MRNYQRKYLKAYMRESRVKALRILAKGETVCCVKCGYQDVRALQIDHVNGGGRAHYKTYSPQSLYLAIIRGENQVPLQILCANCNWIKRFENNEMPGRPRVKEETQISMLDEWPEDNLIPLEE